jgi:hypothetical protein
MGTIDGVIMCVQLLALIVLIPFVLVFATMKAIKDARFRSECGFGIAIGLLVLAFIIVPCLLLR